MSLSQNPMTGHMSGSMANFATYTRFGKNIIRSKAFQPRNANTVSQIAQRASFKLIVKAYQSFGDITGTSFPLRPENQIPFNAFMEVNLPEAIDKTGETPAIDYSKLSISKGSLPVAIVISAVTGATGITLNYRTFLRDAKNSETDQLVAVAKMKTGDLIVERKDRGNEATGTILLPYADIDAADVECCYLFVQSVDKSNASDSTFVAIN